MSKWASFPTSQMADGVCTIQNTACGLPRRCFGKIGSAPHATDRGEVWTLNYDSPAELIEPANTTVMQVFDGLEDDPSLTPGQRARVQAAGPKDPSWVFPGQGPPEEPPGQAKKLGQ